MFYYHLNIYNASLDLLNEKILNFVDKFSNKIDSDNLDSILYTSELFENYSDLITYKSSLMPSQTSQNNLENLDNVIEWLDFENDYLNDLNLEKISNISEGIIQSKNMIRSISEALVITFADDDKEKFLYSKEFLKFNYSKSRYNVSMIENSRLSSELNIKISYTENYDFSTVIESNEIDNEMIKEIELFFKDI